MWVYVVGRKTQLANTTHNTQYTMTDINTLKDRRDRVEEQLQKVSEAEEKGTLTHTKFSKLFHESRTNTSAQDERFVVVWDLDDNTVQKPQPLQSGTHLQTPNGKYTISLSIKPFSEIQDAVRHLKYNLEQLKMGLDAKIRRKQSYN